MVKVFPKGNLYYVNFDKIKWRKDMEEVLFTCDCCEMEYEDVEMNEVGEHYICDSCVEEIGE